MEESLDAAIEGEVEEEGELMSEIHLGCPANFCGPYISRFTFPFPLSTVICDGTKSIEQLHMKCTSNSNVSLDEDGDLDLPRRGSNSQQIPICTLAIKHNITTTLPSVGLQVWKAALVLSDFILHKISTTSEFSDVTAIELGAGTGLAGMILALVAKKVYITDKGLDILGNCATNAQLNSSLFKHPESRICVRELDWKDEWPPSKQTCHPQSQRSTYSWASSEIEEAQRATVLIAADVIYSDELTRSFFDILEKLMSRGSEKVLYLALEKRYNFSMDDFDVVANGYAYFKKFLDNNKECRKVNDNMLTCFKGDQLDLDQIPQYIREYERGKDVELWKIIYCPKVARRR